MTMPTMQEIDEYEEAIRKVLLLEYPGLSMKLSYLAKSARRGVDAAVCPDCKNIFHQPFKCVTCGAQKLYDATLLAAQQRAEKAEERATALDEMFQSQCKKTDEATHRAMTAEAALAEAVRRERELASECVEAWENAVDWAGYASEYFRDKHGCAADVAALDNAAKRLKEIRARNQGDSNER